MGKSVEHWDKRIGRRLRLRDLHVLLTVVRSGSMAKAARNLSVSQPAISKAMTDLEHILGVRLLDRGPQGVQATVYGDALVRRGLAVFGELQQAVADIAFIANPASGDVNVGCNESLAASLMPAVVEQLASHHPGIAVHLRPMTRPITQEIRHLRERSVDFIVGRGLFQVPENDLNSEVLFEEPLRVVAGATSSWAKHRKLQLADLLEAKWIMYPPDEAPGTLVTQAFQQKGLTVPRAVVTTSSFHVREALLRQSDYLTVVPACMLRVFNADRLRIKALQVDLGVGIRPVAVFTLKHRTMHPAADIVIESVRAAARTIDPGS